MDIFNVDLDVVYNCVLSFFGETFFFGFLKQTKIRFKKLKTMLRSYIKSNHKSQLYRTFQTLVAVSVCMKVTFLLFLPDRLFYPRMERVKRINLQY